LSPMVTGYARFWRWSWSFLVLAPLAWMALLAGVVHPVFKIPIVRLGGAFLCLSGLTMIAAPFVFWAREHYHKSGGDKRLMTVVILSFSVAWSLVAAFYGIKLGIIPAEDARALYLTCLLGIPLGYILGNCIHRIFFRRSNDSSKSRHSDQTTL